MAIPKNFPLQQGSLDYFCSIYASLNLLHLKGRLDNIDDASVLFKEIIYNIAESDDGDIAGYVTEGIDPVQIPWLLVASRIVEIEDCVIEIEANMIRENIPALVFLCCEDGFTHYTVVNGMKENGEFTLFDSYGFSGISLGDAGFMLNGVLIKELQAWTTR
ncbi:hypothetical protein [Zavarzinia aquatilis]|uniref:hypothetical protein n=1 Tax=Zavarzinia aquatilis TaxID=2211142 RepID=UPI0010579446|nr:hypothetical protein [Zavarzinia aquatilis]